MNDERLRVVTVILKSNLSKFHKCWWKSNFCCSMKQLTERCCFEQAGKALYFLYFSRRFSIIDLCLIKNHFRCLVNVKKTCADIFRKSMVTTYRRRTKCLCWKSKRSHENVCRRRENTWMVQEQMRAKFRMWVSWV